MTSVVIHYLVRSDARKEGEMGQEGTGWSVKGRRDETIVLYEEKRQI